LAFLGQFYCLPTRLNLPGTLCVQLYQDRWVGEGGDPCPVAMRVPTGAPANVEAGGIPQRGIVPHDIDFLEIQDPESEPEFPNDLTLSASKIGGLCLHTDALDARHRFLLQLAEEPGAFNFAGRICIVALSEGGELQVSLE
jgi:hypothetical protein